MKKQDDLTSQHLKKDQVLHRALEPGQSQLPQTLTLRRDGTDDEGFGLFQLPKTIIFRSRWTENERYG